MWKRSRSVSRSPPDRFCAINFLAGIVKRPSAIAHQVSRMSDFTLLAILVMTMLVLAVVVIARWLVR